jgi:hypothetical protein
MKGGLDEPGDGRFFQIARIVNIQHADLVVTREANQAFRRDPPPRLAAVQVRQLQKNATMRSFSSLLLGQNSFDFAEHLFVFKQALPD